MAENLNLIKFVLLFNQLFSTPAILGVFKIKKTAVLRFATKNLDNTKSITKFQCDKAIEK